MSNSDCFLPVITMLVFEFIIAARREETLVITAAIALSCGAWRIIVAVGKVL